MTIQLQYEFNNQIEIKMITISDEIFLKFLQCAQLMDKEPEILLKELITTTVEETLSQLQDMIPSSRQH